MNPDKQIAILRQLQVHRDTRARRLLEVEQQFAVDLTQVIEMLMRNGEPMPVKEAADAAS